MNKRDEMERLHQETERVFKETAFESEQKRIQKQNVTQIVLTGIVMLFGFYLFLGCGVGFFASIIPVGVLTGTVYLYLGSILEPAKDKPSSSSGGLAEKIGQALIDYSESYKPESPKSSPTYMSGVGMDDEQYVRCEDGRYRFVIDRYGNEKRLTKEDDAWYDDEGNHYEEL